MPGINGLRVDPFSEGRQINFDKVASPENVFFPLQLETKAQLLKTNDVVS